MIKLTKHNYITRHSVNTLLDNITFSISIILSPHKSLSSDIEYTLEVYKKTGRGRIITTPKEFVIKHNFIKNLLNVLMPSHLLVEDYDVMDTFGYSSYLKDIKEMKYNFIYITTSTVPECKLLNFYRYVIKCRDKDYFYYIYLLYLKYTTNLVILCRNVKRMNLFCDILNIKCIIDTEYKDEYYNSVCVVTEEYKEIEGFVIYLGLDCTGIEMKVLENYRILYRIKDLVKSLTKDVVNGRKKINSDRFKNILKK